MIRRLCLTVLLVFLALPAYAGHGTIRETDTQIFVEYYGDDNEIQVFKVLKKEEQKKVASEEKIETHNQAISEMKAARRAENRKEEE